MQKLAAQHGVERKYVGKMNYLRTEYLIELARRYKVDGKPRALLWEQMHPLLFAVKLGPHSTSVARC